MTTDRNPATSPVFKAFQELAHLPPAERNEALMVRLEHVWKEAQESFYVTKKGKKVNKPDGTLQLKVIQAVAVLQGLTGDVPEGDQAKLANMTDTDLVREAMRRLPAHDVQQLADALIALREQERNDQAIVVTTAGEKEHGSQEEPKRGSESKQRRGKPQGASARAAKPGPKWT